MTDVKDKFILEEVNGSPSQRKLLYLKDKIVHFILDDHLNEGFHIVFSSMYDDYLDVGHSNKHLSKVKFPRSVEPGSIKIFDIHTEEDAE